MAGSGRARRAPRGPLWASFRGLPARAVARYRAAFAQVAGGSGWVAFALPISAPATGHDGPSLTRMFLCICIPWLVCYVAACIIWPYAKCLKCKGTGQHPVAVRRRLAALPTMRRVEAAATDRATHLQLLLRAEAAVTVRTKTGTPAEVAAWAAQLRNEAGDRISGVQLAPVPGQPGMVVARATVVPVVQVRAYTRVQGQPVRWSVRRRLAAGTAAALPVLGAGRLAGVRGVGVPVRHPGHARRGGTARRVGGGGAGRGVSGGALPGLQVQPVDATRRPRSTVLVGRGRSVSGTENLVVEC
jgi:hypothetical protein